MSELISNLAFLYKLCDISSSLSDSQSFDKHKPIWCSIDGKYKEYFKKDKSQEKGFWADEETWFDDKNRMKQNVNDLLKGLCAG